MKKNLLIGAFALIAAFALVFTGCDPDGNGDEKDTGTAQITITGIPSEDDYVSFIQLSAANQACGFAEMTGNLNPGGMLFPDNTVVPAPKIENGTAVMPLYTLSQVQPYLDAAQSLGSGAISTLPALNPAKITAASGTVTIKYADFEDSTPNMTRVWSNVTFGSANVTLAWADGVTPAFTITITGERPAADLVGASLMNPAAPTVPVAVALLTTPPYQFKVPGAGGIPSAENFNTPGTYILGTANMSGGNVHMYTGGTLEFSRAVTHHDLTWAQFAQP